MTKEEEKTVSLAESNQQRSETQSGIFTGPWHITDTVSSTRKNLFCMAPSDAHHIATIVSGSRSQISRFEESLVLIRAAPELFQQLSAVLSLIRSVDATTVSSLSTLAEEIELTLSRASPPFSEG